MKIRTFYIVLGLAFRLAVEPAGAAQLEEASAAFERGDFAKALNLYLPLAKQGNVEAQLSVGTIIRRGDVGAPNSVEAAMWYRLAADQGNSLAQTMLAVIYEEALGVSRNYSQAVRWYKLAAEQGNDIVQFGLAAL